MIPGCRFGCRFGCRLIVINAVPVKRIKMPTFIETQFPIARLSAESYKERKAGASQTLTGLGKWWGASR